MNDRLLKILSTFVDLDGICFLHLFGFRKIWVFLRLAGLFPVSNYSPYSHPYPITGLQNRKGFGLPVKIVFLFPLL